MYDIANGMLMSLKYITISVAVQFHHCYLYANLSLISVYFLQAAADDHFKGHESAVCPVITSEPQKVTKILTAAGWSFFESWKD